MAEQAFEQRTDANSLRRNLQVIIRNLCLSRSKS